LNSDGSIDNTFNVGLGPDNTVFAISIQDDGKILVGGAFQTFNGFDTRRIVRLNTDGSVDESFNNILTNGSFSSFNNSGSIRTISIQNDENIIIGGDFSVNNGISYGLEFNNLARLDSNGVIDINYLPRIYTGGLNNPIAINGRVRTSVLLNDGSLLIGGEFTSYYGSTSLNRLARLSEDGSLDPNFNAGNISSTYFWPGSGNHQPPIINKVAPQNDGKILVGGRFTMFNGSARNNILRLNIDGSIDQSFAGPGTNDGNAWIYDIAIQNNGKIVLVGDFISYNSINCTRIVRINADGSYDHQFSPFFIPSANNVVYTVKIKNNGNIIIGGYFTEYFPAPLGGTSSKIAQLSGDCIEPPAPSGEPFQSFCLGATLSDLNVSGSNIKWYDNNGNLLSNPNLILTSGETYYASQTITCESTALLQVSVVLEQPITPNFNQINTICSGQTLNALPNTSLNNISGTWSPSINNTATTTYTFTPNLGQCANIQTMTVSVNPLPTVTLAAFTPICDTLQPFTLTGGLPLGGAYAGPSVASNSFNPAIGPGQYTIQYAYTDIFGCSNAAAQTITVIGCNTATISENDKTEIRIYPNPTATHVTIVAPEYVVGKRIYVYDLNGKLILETLLLETIQTVNLDTVATGSYYLKIEDETTTFKLIKH
jgi:uncharacterized delta-60 repeat protein